MATTAEVRRCTRIHSEQMRGRTVLERDSMSTTRNTRKESMHYLNHYESPLGAMTMASDGDRLTGLWFDGQKYDRSTINDEAALEPDLPVFTRTAQWLDTYFGGPDPGFTPPIRVEAPTSRGWSPPSCSPSPSAPPAPMPASPPRWPGVLAASRCPHRPWVARSGAIQSFSSCRAIACSPPTGACAATREESIGRNGFCRWRASTCPVCQRRQTLTTAVEGQNEKADRGPDQTLEYPSDRADGEMQPIRQQVIRHMNSSVHADGRPGRPGDRSNDQCCHRESTRHREICDVLQQVLLTPLG